MWDISELSVTRQLLQNINAFLSRIEIPIVEIRRSHDRPISTMGFFYPW